VRNSNLDGPASYAVNLKLADVRGSGKRGIPGRSSLMSLLSEEFSGTSPSIPTAILRGLNFS
jgi:hypothetical protein